MPSKPTSAVPNKVTIVMVGPTGQGKSTLGNLLAGGGPSYAPFTTSDDFDSETIEASHSDFTFEYQPHRAIDTIGFLDTRMDACQNMDKFAGFADRAPGGIDAFLFVLKKGRFTQESLAQISAFRSVAGDEALKHTIMIFTHCGTETNESLRERCFRTENQYMRQAMECCANVAGVDSVSPDRVDSDRIEVLGVIKEVVKCNDGMKYENVALVEARRRREELQEKIQKLSAERREAMQDKLDGLFHGRYNYEQVSKATEEALLREEEEKKRLEEAGALKALLAAAKSEAAAWKEVARGFLASQQAQHGGAFGNCCGPQGQYDPNEATFDDNNHNNLGMPGMGGGNVPNSSQAGGLGFGVSGF